MTVAARLLFWMCLALLVYTYFGYPRLLLPVLAWLRPRPIRKEDIRPSVSLIIAAYNEETDIRAKIENSLALDYPPDLLEILVVADGSTDRTVEIARAYEGPRVRVLHEPGRKGKASALNRAAAIARGDILLLSDANNEYVSDTVQRLVRNFADLTVGGVTGRKIVFPGHGRGTTEGETAYWKYEAAIKELESTTGSIVTGGGEIFAIRRSLYQPLPASVVHDDMFLTLHIVQRGFRACYETEATSGEAAPRSLRDDFQRKVRYAAGGYQLMRMYRELLWPPVTLFAFQFWSHKVLRWLAPFLMIGTLVGSALAAAPVYRVAVTLQALFYATAAVGWLLDRRQASSGLLAYPLYFCMGNLALLLGAFRQVTGGQSTLWHRAER